MSPFWPEALGKPKHPKTKAAFLAIKDAPTFLRAAAWVLAERGWRTFPTHNWAEGAIALDDLLVAMCPENSDKKRIIAETGYNRFYSYACQWYEPRGGWRGISRYTLTHWNDQICKSTAQAVQALRTAAKPDSKWCHVNVQGKEEPEWRPSPRK